MKLIFITGNKTKLLTARSVCSAFGVELEQSELDIQEIQAEDGTIIAADKVKKAYEQLQKPVVVSDDSWIIPGLGGFPGPYMKSMNHWFKPEDWLRLTRDLQDRRIILQQVVAYHDGDTHHLFSVKIEGRLLSEIRGTSPHPHTTITSFDADGRSAAEMNAEGRSATAHRPTAWRKLCEWLAKQPG